MIATKKATRKLTVRFSRRLKSEMQSNLINEGYGLHGKSKWLKDTIIHFLSLPNYIDCVEHGININQSELTQVEAFYLDADVMQLMKDAFIKVRSKYPLLEGVQSAFIRASVVSWLMLK